MKNALYSLFSLILLSTACKNESMPTEAPAEATPVEEVGLIALTQKQFDASGYEMDGFARRQFSTNLKVNGMIHLPEKNKAMVSSYLGGVVNGMDLIPGQWVKKGQRLFTLTNPELINWQQEFLETKGQLDYLKDEHARQKQLAEENISARKNYLRAQADLNMAEAKYAALSTKLRMIGINPASIQAQELVHSLGVYAPISGYISDIQTVNGSFLNATVPALEISNTDHLHMELKVMETDVNKLRDGQKIRFSTQGNPQATYTATVHLIEKMVDENRMVNVHCHLDETPDQHFLVGMYVTAEIMLVAAESAALPEEAVVSVEDRYYVLMQEEDGTLNFLQKEVEPGERQNGYVQILNSTAFQPDDIFLTRGAYYQIFGE